MSLFSPDELVENPDPSLTLYASPVKLTPAPSSAALENWLSRPMGERERQQITAQAKANAIHRFNCICEACSDKRRALIVDQATNQPRLLSDAEYSAIHGTDILGKVFAILLFFGFALLAFQAVGQ